MPNDLQADLTADLLSDLGRPAPLPSAPVPAMLPSTPVSTATPVLQLTFTPLSWSLPSLDSTERGLGLAVRLGPVRVEIAL